MSTKGTNNIYYSENIAYNFILNYTNCRYKG